MTVDPRRTSCRYFDESKRESETFTNYRKKGALLVVRCGENVRKVRELEPREMVCNLLPLLDAMSAEVFPPGERSYSVIHVA